MDLSSIKAFFDNIVGKQDFGGESPDYEGLNDRIALLERMSEVENSSIAIFDLYKKEFISVRPKYNDQVLIDLNKAYNYGPSYYISLMHPDDIPIIMDTYKKVFEFSFKLPIEERRDYKTIFNFRIKNEYGKCFHFIQQIVTLELDKKGNIWLGLSIADMLPDNTKFDKVHRRVINIKSGKYYLFENDTAGESILSKREIEILGLVSKGFLSKEIADKLFISVNTVNNHRQRILEKINAANISEAITFARSLGLM